MSTPIRLKHDSVNNSQTPRARCLWNSQALARFLHCRVLALVFLLRAIYLVLEFIDGKELFDEIVEGSCALLGFVNYGDCILNIRTNL